MVEDGAQMMRLNPEMPECVPTILEWFVSRSPTDLAIRDEMVHQGKPFAKTSVWPVILERLRDSLGATLPEMSYIRDIITPAEMRAEIYKLAFECLKLKQELENYKKKLEEPQ